MANRITTLRGSDYGLWVSKPGFNVLTTGAQNLLFNSDYASFGAVDQGTFTVTFPGNDGNNVAGNIMFGQDFGTPPFVLFEHQIGGLWRIFDRGNNFVFGKRVNIYDYSFDPPVFRNTVRFSVSTEVQSDRIVVRRSYNKANRNVMIPDFPFRYSVFTYNY